MKMKSLFSQYMEEFMDSEVEYCCYCFEPKGDKYSCCQENHFITFRDFDRADQVGIIENELQLSFDLEDTK